MTPLKLCAQDSLELVAHETVDDEVSGGIENEEPVHEAGEAEEPGRVCHMGGAEHIRDENVDRNHEIQLPNDVV